MSYLIKNGWILNENGEKTEADIRVTGETITAIGKLDATDNETVIDAKGLLVSYSLLISTFISESRAERKRNN